MIAASRASSSPTASAAAKRTKANSPPCAKSVARSAGLGAGCSEGARHGVGAQRLEDHGHGHPDQHALPFLGDDRQVERHSHAQEEQPEQQAAERLDVGLELVAEGGFRQQHSGHERAHGHRQTRRLHHDRGAEHHEQRACGHHLARTRPGEHAEQRIEQPAAGGDHGGDRSEGDERTQPWRSLLAADATRAEQRDRGEERHDGQVLEQQDRHRALAGGRADRAALFEHLHDHRRGGQDEAHRADGGRDPRQPGQRARRREQHAAAEHLHDAEAEDLAAQRPQLGWADLQPDDEQEQHHPELGQVQQRLGIAHHGRSVGPERQAGRQVPQHRTEPQLAEERHRERAGPEQREHLREPEARGFGSHWNRRDAKRWAARACVGPGRERRL
jgi:hypothetical protein